MRKGNVMTKNYIPIADMAVTVDRIVDAVFVEVGGKTDYRPEYLKTSSDFYKIMAFCPEIISEDEFENGLMSMSDFFENVENGKYTNELSELRNHPQCIQIDEYVEKKISFKLSQMSNTLAFALSGFFDTLNTLISGHETEIIDIVTKSLEKTPKKTSAAKNNKSKSPIKMADKKQ